MNQHVNPFGVQRIAPRITAILATVIVNIAFVSIFLYGGQSEMQKNPAAQVLACKDTMA